ncbi:MAG: PadR family transcriptional regulator [Gemmatimonadota bacterium]|nr:PadR family transcriptional regulator [Gemmatimonadota bacterium]
MGEYYLGEFEHLVLLAILRLKGEAYGVPIRRTIEERAERPVSFGAVYATLRRLDSKGLIAGVQQPTQDPAGGRPKTVFRLTETGAEALRSAQRRLTRMADGIGEWRTENQ